MAQFSAAPQSGPIPSPSSSTSTSSFSGSSSASATTTTANFSERRVGDGLALVGPDEPWASGQRKRYLNSLQTSELAA